ncbi:Gag protein [Phytophthora palmivora]|uniref:Gag protein n=1 Tax=Phytophthora palmivora TaxID=4796 RepID=A0A2P4WZV4_9STRA|nr:Gag protein [Phytophthora palmivora]
MDRAEFPHLTDSQFESVRKMVGIFRGDALRSLAAATPAEQVERIEAFDTAFRSRAEAAGPVAEMKQSQPKPLRLKVKPYEGKEGENLHFWVREVELAMDAALISTERLRVAFALSNLGVAFLPANYEYRQRSRFPAYKQEKLELLEYIQQMRGTPYPNTSNLKSDGVNGWPDGGSIAQATVPRIHASTIEQAIQVALQEEYRHRQARTPTSLWQGHNASAGAVQGAPVTGASIGPVPMKLGTDVQSSFRCYICCNGPALREGRWPKILGNWGHQ